MNNLFKILVFVSLALSIANSAAIITFEHRYRTDIKLYKQKTFDQLFDAYEKKKGLRLASSS